jgi:hypothetical protein
MASEKKRGCGYGRSAGFTCAPMARASPAIGYRSYWRCQVDRRRFPGLLIGNPKRKGYQMAILKVLIVHCERCGHEWAPRQTEIRICPKCKSPYWDKPKRKKK